VTMVEDGLPGAAEGGTPEPIVLPVGESRPRRRPPMLAVVLLSACVGLVGGAAAAWGLYQRLGPVERIITQSPQFSGGPVSPSYQSIAATAAPSVVKILTRPLAPADLAGRPAGFAVGFVASADGLVVTSAHALSGATRLRIAFPDGHAVDASVAGTDLIHGLAVLRAADARALTPLPFASADGQAPRPGDLAITVGSPPFATTSVTTGQISSTGRVVPAAAAGVAGGTVVDVTTVDATADPSEDGAPVLDAAGRVIGVVLAGGDGAPPGVLALSGRSAADLVAAIERGGSARRPTLGVDAVVLDPATAVAVGLRPGALVRAVVPAGPSDAAGLIAGDDVTALDGIALDAQHPLDAVTLSLTEGQRVVLTVVRGGVELSLSVVVGGG
jgi:putative serine protease PepD